MSRPTVIGGTAASGFAATIGLILLHQDGRGTGLCSGTFIRDDLVVTAGHCFRGMQARGCRLFAVGFELLDFGTSASFAVNGCFTERATSSYMDEQNPEKIIF